MHQVGFHAAFCLFTLGKYAVSRRRLIKRSVRPPRVAEPGPVIDDLFCLEAVGDLVQIHSLLLQGPPEPLDENVVQIPSSAIH